MSTKSKKHQHQRSKEKVNEIKEKKSKLSANQVTKKYTSKDNSEAFNANSFADSFVNEINKSRNAISI